METQVIEGLVFFVVIVIAVVGSFVWMSSRSRAILSHWADERGHRIIEAHYAALFRGPFFWTSSRNQTVYRVVMEEPGGLQRQGWVRCGSRTFGLLSDQAEVRWDDE